MYNAEIENEYFWILKCCRILFGPRRRGVPAWYRAVGMLACMYLPVCASGHICMQLRNRTRALCMFQRPRSFSTQQSALWAERTHSANRRDRSARAELSRRWCPSSACPTSLASRCSSIQLLYSLAFLPQYFPCFYSSSIFCFFSSPPHGWILNLKYLLRVAITSHEFWPL